MISDNEYKEMLKRTLRDFRRFERNRVPREKWESKGWDELAVAETRERLNSACKYRDDPEVKKIACEARDILYRLTGSKNEYVFTNTRDQKSVVRIIAPDEDSAWDELLRRYGYPDNFEGRHKASGEWARWTAAQYDRFAGFANLVGSLDKVSNATKRALKYQRSYAPDDMEKMR